MRGGPGLISACFVERVKVVDFQELIEPLREALSPEELKEVSRLDLMVRGRIGDLPGKPDVLLAVEVSAMVDVHDVEGASRRARLLRKAGFEAIPVAAGEEITKEAEEMAKIEKVALMCDGSISLWEEALKESLGIAKE